MKKLSVLFKILYVFCTNFCTSSPATEPLVSMAITKSRIRFTSLYSSGSIRGIFYGDAGGEGGQMSGFGGIRLFLMQDWGNISERMAVDIAG